MNCEVTYTDQRHLFILTKQWLLHLLRVLGRNQTQSKDLESYVSLFMLDPVTVTVDVNWPLMQIISLLIYPL